MTAKVTLSFSDDTIEEARRFAKREGLSLSAWMDQAAREKALREVFAVHAAVIGRGGQDLEGAALADEREIEMVDDVLLPEGAGRGRGGSGGTGRGQGGSGGTGRGRGGSGGDGRGRRRAA